MKNWAKYIVCLCASLLSLSAVAQAWTPFGELLVWHASEQTSSIWLSDITNPSPGVLSFSPSDINFHWTPGFRGGLSYEAPNFWNTKIYWTYYPTSTTMNYSVSKQVLAPEFFSGFLSGDLFFGASVNWQIVMNTLDIELGHEFSISHALFLNPHIGLKAATINQNINSTWNAVIYNSTEKVTNNFSGIGPSFGIEGKWNFYKELSFAGDFSGALLWGNWNDKDTYSRPSALFGLVSPTTITTRMDNSKLGTAMFQYFIGLQFTHKSTYATTFQLGYEMQYWANQLRVPTFQQLPMHGDLTVQGATCGFSIKL